MSAWLLLFFVLAVIAGVLGFAVIASAAAATAKVMFFVFTGLFLLGVFDMLTSKHTGDFS